MTKQEKIEKLIQMEWEDFQKVNNEGGRASCQDDPETFLSCDEAILHRGQRNSSTACRRIWTAPMSRGAIW